MTVTRNTSGQQDGSPDLFHETLYYPRNELRATVIAYLDRCLGLAVTESDFETGMRDIRMTDEQCSKVIEVLKKSDGDIDALRDHTDDADIAFLILRLILGCVF